MNTKLLEIASNVEILKSVFNRLSVLSSIREIQNDKRFKGWYLDQEGIETFSIDEIESGERYDIYSVLSSEDIEEDEVVVDAIKFTTDTSAVIGMSIEATGQFEDISLEYSYDGKNWFDWDLSSKPINSGDNLYVRGNNPNGFSLRPSTSSYRTCTFTTTGGNIYCSGNIMTLIGDAQSTSITKKYMFEYLFADCANLITPPELPATTLSDYSYRGMFQNCTSLEIAPELPAKTVGVYCYSNMFNGCTSLTKAPELPADTIAKYCYENMFFGCTGLIEPPSELPAISMPTYCYRYMFKNCSSLLHAPYINGETTDTQCCREMFSGCKSLLDFQDVLKPETGAQACYYNMFNGCIALKKAPNISLKEIGVNSCYGMFYDCQTLETPPSELYPNVLDTNCYYSMFYRCRKLKYSPVISAKTLASNCFGSMFRACNTLEKITILCEDANMFNYTTSWVSDVSKTGTIHASPNRLWPENQTGISAIPAGWNIVDIQ